MSVTTASRLREWANSNQHQAPPAWVGDRANGYTAGDGDQLRTETPRNREWASTAYGFDALGRVQHGADPHDLVAHVFDNRLNALGLAEWLERKGPNRARVAVMLGGWAWEGVVGGGD